MVRTARDSELPEVPVLLDDAARRGFALDIAVLDWGYDAEVEDERVVNVHIRRLREKIEPDPSHPSLILTVPGIGYRLVR